MAADYQGVALLAVPSLPVAAAVAAAALPSASDAEVASPASVWHLHFAFQVLVEKIQFVHLGGQEVLYRCLPYLKEAEVGVHRQKTALEAFAPAFHLAASYPDAGPLQVLPAGP